MTKQPYFTAEQWRELKKQYSTLPVDGDGNVQEAEYNDSQVRNDVLKLESDIQRYREALEWIKNDAPSKWRKKAMGALKGES